MAKKTKRPKLHNHVRKILSLARLGKLPVQPGDLSVVDVHHDDWCAFYGSNGHKRCNCDPDIRLRWTHPTAARN
jgi:hypothetical protein